jgi:MoxR-like ATPase
MPDIKEMTRKLTANIKKVIVGKDTTIELLMVAMLCDGHVLLEDVPGVGKTMLARSLAVSMGGAFKRLQCTPDLLPNDITGVSIFNQAEGDFQFRPGPVFVNVLLADEINRATPRTQSALLEAMQESQITIDGTTHPLPKPFLVLATQNPVEYEGTFPLPEAQLDRFLIKIDMGYPTPAEEKQMMQRMQFEHPIESLEPILEPADIKPLKTVVQNVHIDNTVLDYIIRMINATRENGDILLGGSPRASISLFKASQALAAIRGRDHVLPDDIKELAVPVLAHRLMLKPEAALRGRTNASLMRRIVENTPLKLQDKDA